MISQVVSSLVTAAMNTTGDASTTTTTTATIDATKRQLMDHMSSIHEIKIDIS